MDAPVKVGDRVWYYFQHAFGRVAQIDEVTHIEVFTGKTEMRCRPARVVAIDLVSEEHIALDVRAAAVLARPRCYLTLDVEFGDDDRQLVPGGVVYRYERRQDGTPDHIGPGWRGPVLGHAWPDDHTWALQAKLAG